MTYISHELAYANYFSKVLILVRNPLDAIPSLCNFVYEYVELKKDKNHHHQVQAPEQYWITFRDNRFDNEIIRWKKSIEYWTDHYDSSHRLVISYEQLTDEYAGSFVTSVLAQFLNKTYTVSTQTLEDIPCVWKALVKGDRDNNQRKKLYVPQFSLKQLQNMQEVISDLIMKYFNTEFIDLFYNYETLIGHERDRIEKFANISIGTQNSMD